MHRLKLAGFLLASVVATGVLGIAGPGTAQGKKAAKGDAAVGFVDLAQITERIKKTPEWQAQVTKFEDTKSKLRDEIETLSKIRYLSTTERSELETLRAKKGPSPMEKARIAELEKKSDTLDQEYNGLVQTEKQDDKQMKRFNELQAQRTENLAELQRQTEKRAQTLQAMEIEVLDNMQKKVLQIVEEVAKKQDMAMVIDRQAVLFGGSDLTPEVLKQLGANK